MILAVTEVGLAIVQPIRLAVMGFDLVAYDDDVWPTFGMIKKMAHLDAVAMKGAYFVDALNQDQTLQYLLVSNSTVALNSLDTLSVDAIRILQIMKKLASFSVVLS